MVYWAIADLKINDLGSISWMAELLKDMRGGFIATLTAMMMVVAASSLVRKITVW